MVYIAGVDVGNNTTEVAIAEVSPEGKAHFLSSATVRTVGIKGTIQNAMGVIEGSRYGPDVSSSEAQRYFPYSAERGDSGHWRCSNGDHH